MNHWLIIALVAYLIGAAIEGVSTVSQLSHSAPELVKSTQAQPLESGNSPSFSWRIIVAIASVSICGAFFWPCRLIHRLMKGNVNS
jgi:NADH:ubiquinone oxidoreductase subunit 3 (subunit A)